jgi:large subunit ribosomal protein L4
MAMTIPLVDGSGTEAGTVEINDAWIEQEKGEQAVHDSVVAFLARIRAGTAAAKTRSNIAGSSKKPYRQKGTGRARAGSQKSPLWRGGGVTFGPIPRSFAKQINRKVERLALKRALYERLAAGDVIVVDDMSLAEPKTKLAASFLKSVGAGPDTLVVVDEVTPELERAMRNLSGALLLPASSVNTYWMLLFPKVVATRAGIEALGQRLSA